MNVDASIPLDARKQQILKAVVADYTATGVPVGSMALAAHLSAWSSATIRNELSTMVEIGYLLQPHTSAGRVPSDLGYRYYVDFLMEEEQVPSGVRRLLEPHFADLPRTLSELLEHSAMALATACDAVSIVTAPRKMVARVKHLDLVSLDPEHALVLLVLEGNLVKHSQLALNRRAEQEELSDLARALNQQLRSLGVDDVAEIRWPGLETEIGPEVLADVVTTMRFINTSQDAMVVHDGVRNLLHHPEFGDIERLQQVLDVVEEERLLGEILTKLDSDQGVQIMIGRENGLEQLSQCSLVLTTYRAGSGRVGTIGVLGPTRMRYSQAAPRVRFVAARLGGAIAKLLG